jgi:oligopeptide transport system ATP-binding protein
MENKTTYKKTDIDYSNKILEIKNLKTYFKVGSGKNKIKVKAVDDISIDIYKKEVFGLVGESGCGKTTASRTIMRLYRPTGGEVKFEGTIIGSGHNEYYKKMKYERIDYKINKLKTNSRKKAIYEINKKYDTLYQKIHDSQIKLENEYKANKKRINQPIEDYKKQLFEARNAYNLAKEKAHYDYALAKEQAFNQTINEEQREYDSIKKVLLKSFKIKLSSLDDSVGLSKEIREQQKINLTKHHEQELLDLEKEYLQKISNKKVMLLPKSEYKKQAVELTKQFKVRRKEVDKENQDHLQSLVKPDKEKIQDELNKLKADYQKNLTKIKLKKDELKKNRENELNQIDKKVVIDTEALEKIKLEHQQFMEEQRAGIKESREKHFAHSAKEQVKKMQMIFQDPISSLNPRMTVGEIVSEGLVINGEKDSEVLKEKVIEALRLVGLAPEYISRYPHEFSGGQRQRIGIARALIMNPTFIIADEPISALDVSIRAQVLNLLTELKDRLDLSILFIAHDLSVVKFFCDRIAVMYAGKIVELAPTDQIFSKPLHPYTRSLLSAIPQPDPDTEKLRKRIPYSAAMHDYKHDKPELREIYTGHFVYCNVKEYEAIKKELGDLNA